MWLMCSAAAAGPVSIALTPADGAVSGLPGSTVGWGFSLTNNSTDPNGNPTFLLVANSYFCEAGQDPQAPLFTTCTPLLGTYNDFIAGNATLVAPGDTTAPQPFDAGSSQGLGEYVIDGAALPGQADSGSLIVVYDLYDADPFGPNGPNEIGGDTELPPINASVTVIGGTSVAPEPGTLLLLGLGLAAMLALTVLRKRQTPWLQ
jgi:hypothetical protein